MATSDLHTRAWHTAVGRMAAAQGTSVAFLSQLSRSAVEQREALGKSWTSVDHIWPLHLPWCLHVMSQGITHTQVLESSSRWNTTIVAKINKTNSTFHSEWCYL